MRETIFSSVQRTHYTAVLYCTRRQSRAARNGNLNVYRRNVHEYVVKTGRVEKRFTLTVVVYFDTYDDRVNIFDLSTPCKR